jgi:hypothetical protein
MDDHSRLYDNPLADHCEGAYGGGGVDLSGRRDVSLWTDSSSSRVGLKELWDECNEGSLRLLHEQPCEGAVSNELLKTFRRKKDGSDPGGGESIDFGTRPFS